MDSIGPASDLLARRAAREAAARERECERVRAALRAACACLMPATRVVVFGSLLHPDRFGKDSDVDLALEGLPEGRTLFGLAAELEEAVGRPVDLVLLEETRLKDKILREGESWTN